MPTPDNILVWKCILRYQWFKSVGLVNEFAHCTHGSREFIPVLFVDKGNHSPRILII
jgi:hypothetical protein